ncbi:acyl-CoA thioesterase [Georgenia sp. Z1491]|uniref:acyl-CoA thioesterase n=1 Tax=Georgenia sp. Z1491 TaxID=3416707 RepID=UPI003CF92BE4
MTGATSSVLLGALELTAAEREGADEAWTAVTGPCPWPKAYGGDMVAQASLAAMRSVDPGRVLHSMHGYFMRPVEIGRPVRYEVDRTRDGRGFSTRQVRGIQAGKVAFLMMASFQVLAAGPEVAAPAPPDVSGPETLPSSADVLAPVEPGTPAAGSMTAEAKEYWSRGRSFDMRHVPGPVYLEVEGGRTRHQAVWVRAFETLPDDDLLHRAALAYVCDYTIIEPILRAAGLPWAEPGLVTASLDHAMWFHRAARVDDWLLYAQEAVSAQDGRGLATGRFFDRDGRLVATVVQEALVRPPAD